MATRPTKPRRRPASDDRSSRRTVASAGSCLLIEEGDLLHFVRGRPREPTLAAIVIAVVAIFYLAVRGAKAAAASDAAPALPGLAVAAVVLALCIAFVARSSRGARYPGRTIVTLDLRRGRLVGRDGETLARLDDVRFTTHWSLLTRYETLRCSYGKRRLMVASVHRFVSSPFGEILHELARRGVTT